MKFSTRELLLFIAIIAVGLAAYKTGNQRGLTYGHGRGYLEAQDHYQVMLSSYARKPELWDYLGHMWKKYPDMQLIEQQHMNQDEWIWYIDYHSKQNGWKHPAVFDIIEKDYNSNKRE